MLAVGAVALWLVVANVIAMLPTRDSHWTSAYILMALAIPLVIWLWVTSGPVMVCAFVLAAMSILRWPMIYMYRWILRQARQHGQR
jgi:hypothetical protein